MEAIRKRRVKRTGRQLIVDLPENFTSDLVDLIIWPTDDQDTPEDSETQKKTKLSSLRSQIKSKMTDSEIDDQLALLRTEWLRDI